jgi:hypothetical protein
MKPGLLCRAACPLGLKGKTPQKLKKKTFDLKIIIQRSDAGKRNDLIIWNVFAWTVLFFHSSVFIFLM